MSLCSLGPPSRVPHGGLEENGPQECTQNRAKLFKPQKKEKTDGGGGGGGLLAGRRRKAFLVGSISAEILEDNTAIWGGRTPGEQKKKKKNPERAEVYRHSGPYRKVTFERTIARLFGHICCMNEA